MPDAEKAAWTLDPLQRFSTQRTWAWVNDQWAASTEQVVHYDGDGDEPGWIVEDATRPDEVTRWVEGADGQVAVQTGAAGGRVLQIVDLHGDVVGTLPVDDGASAASWSALRLSSFDEFGNPVPMSGAASSNAPPARYGWLGAAQRSADTPAGVLLMGVRLYHPAIGRFLQVDPVPGGSAGAYDYCNADPVNCTDLGGTIAWGKVLGVVAAVGEVASMIPGPIGAASAAVSAVAYAANGNKGKALEMGVTAAASLVGAGAAVKAVSTAVRAGRAAKVAGAAAKVCNSFVAGTLVRLADGSTAPIESLTTGDEVLARDPLTGEVTREVVIAPIWSAGVTHLIRVSFAGQDDAILSTANHPFWVDGEGWVDAVDLAVGDHAVGRDGRLHPVARVDDLGDVADATVFNLHTSGAHTYFVTTGGDDEYLVHNAACTPGPTSALREAVKKVATAA
ncbi:polymorphic toxin-type HINT domain-containing protein [Cellulomonas iranensis]|uniref:polymorphic toxin-type HINT domain-containing protein n=1 Tax=Cellulomonas iranensis TaxID=76862 RepID=UPI003D7DD318